MPEMTPEKLREDALELDGTMQDIYTRRMIAAASAWEADLIMRGDGICLTHGVYSVDEDNPEGDCKVCRLLARIEALEKALLSIAGLEEKSILEAFCYQGPPSKAWIKARGQFVAERYDGYNEAIRAQRKLALAALAAEEET